MEITSSNYFFHDLTAEKESNMFAADFILLK